MQALQARATAQSPPVVPETAGAAPDPATLPPVFAPEDVFDSITAAEFARARQPLPPVTLKAKPGKQDFDLTGDPKTLFDQVAQRFGLETVYDGDFPVGGRQLRFQISGVDYREALHDLEAMTSAFVVPVSSSLIIVAQDTPQKRNDLEQTMLVSVTIPEGLSTQELTEITQAVKQAMNVDKISWDTTAGTIVIRDRVSRALPAQALLQQLFSWRPEVMIELEFLDVSDSDIINYGFNVTNQFPAIILGDIMNNVVNIPAGVTALATFGGGKTLIGIGVAEVDAMFNQTTSTARNLYRAQVRSVDGQPATFHVGEKYPIITQQYAGAVPAGQQANVFAPPPSITFENLGLDSEGHAPHPWSGWRHHGHRNQFRAAGRKFGEQHSGDRPPPDQHTGSAARRRMGGGRRPHESLHREDTQRILGTRADPPDRQPVPHEHQG